jgi:hypothetical protein
MFQEHLSANITINHFNKSNQVKLLGVCVPESYDPGEGAEIPDMTPSVSFPIWQVYIVCTVI